MPQANQLPLFVSIPHAGEVVPKEVSWLQNLPETILMRDVDRYVDKLYKPILDKFKIPSVVATHNRYVVDLNRKADEYDASSVVGATHPKGVHPKGLHWSVTTHNEVLIPKPMSPELHQTLVKNYYQPFHDSVHEMGGKILEHHQKVFHMDLHSMPSLGTDMHPDPGQTRAEVVISDFHGTSCTRDFRNAVLNAFQAAEFEVAYNWPYIGGGITKMYGRPDQGWSTIQIELNRDLYMNEETKEIILGKSQALQLRLDKTFTILIAKLQEIVSG